MSRRLALAAAFLLAACLVPVPEGYCTRDAECPATARCALGQCLWPDGGVAPYVDGGVPDAGAADGGRDAGGGAGGDGGLGGPCAFNLDCRAGASCIPEADFDGPTGFPGGLCVQLCGAAGPCPAGSTCVVAAAKGVGALCLPSCPAPGAGRSTCRQGYLCLGGADAGACRPSCAGGGLAACTAPASCDTGTGQCR